VAAQVACAANANATNIDLLTLIKAGGSTLGTTVMRSHLQMDVTSTVTLNDTWLWGLLVETNDEIVTSVSTTSCANPLNTPSADWMMWRREIAAPTYRPGTSNRLEVDLKAKRKVEELNQTLLYSQVCDSVAAGGRPLTVRVHGRVLLALP